MPILYIVSAIALLYVNSSVLATDGNESDSCASGFMSQGRIDALLQDTSDGHTAVLMNAIAQGIFPGMNFTCNGNIQSLIFGANWTNSSNQAFPELQIWRLTEMESYIKVRSALIKVTRENTSKLYWYNLTSPLAFEAGDILGYYQPNTSTCQLALYFEREAEEGQAAHFYGINSSSHLVSEAKIIKPVQLLLDVVTGSSTSVLPTTSHPMISATGSTSSQVLTHELSVETEVTNTPILTSLSPTWTITDELMITTFKPFTTHLTMTYTTMSSLTNEHYLSSVTRLTTYQSALLSVSSSHPPHISEDEGPNKGISGVIYIISTAVVVLLVTVVVIIIAILACVLQQRRREAMDVLHMKKIKGNSHVYSGSNIYEVISHYQVAQPASFQKSKTYKEQINALYESSEDSDVDENEHEAVQLSLF